MLEPYDGKLSRTVLRGERSRKAPDLPGVAGTAWHDLSTKTLNCWASSKSIKWNKRGESKHLSPTGRTAHMSKYDLSQKTSHLTRFLIFLVAIAT